MYVVVCVGATTESPLAATVPIPEICTVSAFWTSQIRVELWPALMVLGCATNLMICIVVLMVVTVTRALLFNPPGSVTVRRKI